ncbi:S-layer homology domain-containing protein [bacterium 210917-DFI.7.65]|nr:S-layer homology domain-containing protein [bacterium 210917-DFI.7.65]
MKKKRILSGVLAAVLALCLVLPAAPQAQAASFTDISDSTVADNAEVLRMLGVLDGTGGGAFQPYGTLTRAQFAKMAVVMLGKKGAVGQYQTYTIFPDVRADHWAAGYINLAVRGEGEEGKDKLLTGYPDGKFHPDEEITFGQTVTILMRMLGYQDSDVGAVWPQGYLNAAANIGLTDGVTMNANAKVNRAQAAQLFCNLLRADLKGGGEYATKLGTLVQDTILLDVAATAEDGSANAIKTTDKTYKVADRPADASMAGRKGTLLLNASGRVLTFIPDKDTSRKIITVSDKSQDSLTDSSGKQYKIHSAVKAYYNGEEKTFGDVQPNIRVGASVTLFFDAAGDLDYLFVSGAVADEAVIVGAQGSTAGFERLTDSSSYAIYKNGMPSSASELRQYDVATYDAATNTIRVSDTKITAYYTYAEPNTTSPVKVKFLGQELPALRSAADSLSGFKLGEQVTFLLTEDNQVAGAVSPQKARGNAVGIATSVSTNEAVVELFCGLTVKGDPKLSNNTVGNYIGQLVKVSSYQKGDQISLSRVTSGGVRGTLDVASRKVGDTELAENVRIYDKVGSGSLVEVKLADVPVKKNSGANVLYAEKNYTGKISLLILDNATGDAYVYGRYKFTPASDENVNARIKVEYGDEEGKTAYSPEAECGGGYKNNDFGGLAFYTNRSGEARLAGAAKVSKLSKVPNSAWNGENSVTFQGNTYLVADDVACYIAAADKWVTVSQARAFSDTADLYYDSIGEKIRIVVVNN